MTKEEAIQTIGDVRHPAIDRTLLDLGIIKQVTVNTNIVYVTLAFPFPNIPIADTLVESVSTPLQQAGAEVVVDMVIMTDEERNRFLKMENEAWTGLD